jgi:flagellin
MSTVINTNIKSLMASNALSKNGQVQRNVMESLSTGKRINRASDDAAGLSIRETMTSQINGLNAAVRNANDGISLLQTADGALNETSNMMQRMRELAALSRTDTYSTVQKAALNDEYVQLASEIDRISNKTQWNGMNVLTGSGGVAANANAGVFQFQIGANAADVYSVTITAMSTGALGIDSATATIDTASGASDAISNLDSALTLLNTQRSTIGAAVNRLTHAVDNLTNISQNTSESRSKVEDTDYASATSELARTQIIQQAATAILAQANQQPQSVLSLLK